MTNGKRVAVAMSGGVDSSTTAAILKEKGFEVFGITLLLAENESDEEFIAGVKSVADHLKIDLEVRNFRDQFVHDVVGYFVQSYESGLTPNPCVKCNKVVKFGSLLEESIKLGADFLATGHYVRKAETENGICLLKGLDSTKDQSYFLYRLNQQQLDKTLFPLGELQKTEVREMARGFGLAVAEKKESQDLCFIGNNNYRDFFLKHSKKEMKKGPIYDRSGKEVGEHKGLWNYTIGQRRGLGVAAAEPLYVVEIDNEKNHLIVATNRQRGKLDFYVEQLNFIDGIFPDSPFTTSVKIRYTAKEIEAEVTPLSEENAKITLSKALPDVTPGQSAVFYEGEKLLGGGIIVKP